MRSCHYFSLILCLCLAGSSFGQFEKLSSLAPADTNTVVIINVEKMHDSPVGKQRGWKAFHETQHAAAPLVVPPSAREFMMATNLDLEFLNPVWQMALIEANKDPLMSEVAAKLGGTVDNIANHEAVLLRGDAYVVQVEGRRVAAMAPANRQQVARWLRNSAKRKGSAFSPYLTEALSYAQKLGTEMVLAIDLTDVPTPIRVKARLDASKTLAGKSGLVDKLTPIIAGIRGVTLGVRTTDNVYGSIRVDFNADAAPLANIGKPLLLEILGNAGALIPEFEKWKSRVDGKSLFLTGTLTDASLRQIFSIADLNAASMKRVFGAKTPVGEGAADDSAIYLATKQHYESVQVLLKDLRQHKKNYKTMGQMGGWYEKYARKVDELPIRNVDDELLEYSAWISGALRQASTSMKGVGIRQGVRQKGVNATGDFTTYNYGYRYGRYGSYGYGYRTGVDMYGAARAENAERVRIRSQERARGATEANNIWTAIDQETANIRRAMTKKFNKEF